MEKRIEQKEPDSAVFSPKDTMRDIFPNRRISKRVREHYDSRSYRRAVSRGIKKANEKENIHLPNWFPYQLRHSGVSETVERDGIDEARAAAGHRSVEITMRYNHRDKIISERQAQRRSNNPFCGHTVLKPK